MLGLRSAEGDDELANSLTDALRTMARKVSGWKVMDRAVRRKFALHPALRALLLATGDDPIAEDGPNNDKYWGVGRDGQGQNKLGRIIERIRADLRANPTRVV